MRMTEIVPGWRCSVESHVRGGKLYMDIHVEYPGRLQMFRLVTHNFAVRWYDFPRLFWDIVIKGARL